MSFICTGVLNTGMRNFSRSINDDDDDNNAFRVDSYNAGIRFGSESEIFAVRSNMKEDRLLLSKLRMIHREKVLSMKNLGVLTHMADCNVENIQKRCRQMKSHLTREQRTNLKHLDEQGRLKNVMTPGINVNSRQKIAQTYRRLYPEQYHEILLAQESNIPRIRIASTAPQDDASSNHNQLSLRHSRSATKSEIPFSNRDHVSLRTDGRITRTTVSARFSKDQILAPQYRVDDAIRIDAVKQKSSQTQNTPSSTVGSTSGTLYRPLTEDLNLRGLQRRNFKLIPCFKATSLCYGSRKDLSHRSLSTAPPHSIDISRIPRTSSSSRL